jgi:deoxyribodipyrimidine photolyase
MQFEEYNGWPNFPTWDVFTVMTSYYETYQELERVANSVSLSQAARLVEQFVKQIVEAWKEGEYTGHEEAAHVQVQDFLMNGVRAYPKTERRSD